ncbi:MAG: HAMP domain-containing histidine kinase, partial [Sulfuritalea sp.]|nr:HAMP domain-containing histidine kinase [Sulfuritalea sp.]
IILAQVDGDASLFRPETMASRHAAMHFGGRPFNGPGPGMPGMGGPASMPGPAGMADQTFLNTYVRLADTQWLHFGTALSPPVAGLPMRMSLTLALLVGAVLLITLLAVRWVTRPLNRLAQAADELGRDLHRPPIVEDGPTEARLAASAFNRMQAQLIRIIDDRTRMLAAMSHDLKTPITRMRLRADLLDDDDLRGRFETDLKEMEAMVRDTLDFMRGLDPGEQRQLVDLNALLGSLAADATEMGQQVVLSGSAAASLSGVSRLLKRCLGNLVDNAVLHGGNAEIFVTDSADALTVTIADRGPGIPDAELEKVFDPFYRRERSRSRETGGTGLGLSIARAVAEFHGGSLSLQNRAGGGLEAVLVLPR